MKIAIISHYHRLSPRLESEVDTLTKIGHSLKIFYWARVNREQIHFIPAVAVNAKIEHEYIFLRAPRGTSLLAWFVFLFYVKLWFALRRQRFDIIHCTHLLLLPFSVAWGRIHGVKVIYDAYEFHVADFGREQLRRLMKLPKLLEFIEDRLVACVDGVLTIDSVRNALVNRYRRLNENVQVLYNVPRIDIERGRDKQDEQEDPSSGNQTVVYVGGLSLAKGVMKTLEAIKHVKGKIPEVRLVLVGSFLDGSQERCQEYVRQQGLQTNVEFVDWLPYTEMFHHLRQARVGLATHQPIHRYWLVSRGNGRKFFTYMQASLPIVGPEFGEVGQVVRDEGCGVLCDTTNPRKIADAITYLLQRPPEAEVMGSRGRKAVEKKYNWSIEKEKLLKVYRKLGANTNEPSTTA